MVVVVVVRHWLCQGGGVAAAWQPGLTRTLRRCAQHNNNHAVDVGSEQNKHTLVLLLVLLLLLLAGGGAQQVGRWGVADHQGTNNVHGTRNSTLKGARETRDQTCHGHLATIRH